MKVFKGKNCDALVELLLECEDKGCLNEAFAEVKAGTVDAAREKHVPAISREGNTVTVSVGSVLHPMLDNHYIQFITLVQGNRSQRVNLKPGEEPVAQFTVADGPVTVYEYCNLHGLWSATL